MARKLINSRYAEFLEDQIIDDEEKNNEFQSFPKLPITLTSVSASVVYDDHGRARKDNDDVLVEPVEQVFPDLPAPLVELELK